MPVTVQKLTRSNNREDDNKAEKNHTHFTRPFQYYNLVKMTSRVDKIVRTHTHVSFQVKDEVYFSFFRLVDDGQVY